MDKQKRDECAKDPKAWFASLDKPLVPLAQELRALVRAVVPEAIECIKWGIPVYESGGVICSFRKGKGYLALQFGRVGTDFDDPEGLLEGSGRQMRHVKIRVHADIKRHWFTAWLQQAAVAHETPQSA